MKTVIIQSVGTANPGIAKAMADAFEINHELFVRLLYNTPSVFLENADDAVAERTTNLLVQLGLEVLCQDAGDPLPEKSEPLDIAVYVTNPMELTKVAGQLAGFIGCKESEALQLLLNEPSVVLGGVSLATAKSLQSRISAEVIVSNPKTDQYTIEITSTDPLLVNQFFTSVKNMGIPHEQKQGRMIPDLSFTQAQELWNKYHNAAKLQIYNQSYRRYQLQLNQFDLEDEVQKNMLTQEVGMPAEILEGIHQHLPVLLDESLNSNDMLSKLEAYTKAGLRCEAIPVPFGKYKIAVNNITDKKRAQEIVSQFYQGAVLSENAWTAPMPLNSVLNRYLEKQLESLGCEIEHQYSEA